jgi:hypothetical protein
LFSLFLLHIQLLRAFPNQFLQIVWVLLQHLKHCIDEIHLSGKVIIQGRQFVIIMFPWIRFK